MKLKRLACLALLSGALAATAPAQATLMLTLDDGVNPSVSVSDGGLGDSNPAAGVVTWIGAIGNWIVNVSTALSLPPPPGVSGFPATLDLSSVDVAALAGGTLTITAEAAGWTTPIGDRTATMDVGGTLAAGATGTFKSFLNSDGLLVNQGPFGSGAFSGSGSAEVNVATDYSLKEVAVLTQNGPGSSSFDLFTSIPEPGMLALIGLGLLGLGFARRRRI